MSKIDYTALAAAGAHTIVLKVESYTFYRDIITEVKSVEAYGDGKKVDLPDDLADMVEEVAVQLAEELEGDWSEAEVVISVTDGSASCEKSES